MKAQSILAGVILLAATAAAGYWLGHHRASAGGDAPDAGAGESAPPPVASVEVAPIESGTISQLVTAYGTIVAPGGEVRVVSVPYESRVNRLAAAPGQILTPGQALIEIEASPATQLLLRQANNALTATERDLKLVQERFDQHLATNAELSTVQAAQQAAKVALSGLEQTGAGEKRLLKADAPGIVSKVDVQTGQVVPAGGPLIEIVARNQFVIRLGVDPQDVGYLKPGQPVSIKRISEPSLTPMAGKILVVGQRLDPMTHLVEVTVQPPAESKLLLDDFVSGQLSRAAAEGLIVPREAILQGEGGDFELFTVKDGKAAKHIVRIGIESDREAQVIADDLKPGDLAVVTGNLELEDGMVVKQYTKPAETEPSTEPSTEPATQPAATQPAAMLPHAGGGSL
jgi:membrane fusion protein (multidrug efflux system)